MYDNEIPPGVIMAETVVILLLTVMLLVAHRQIVTTVTVDTNTSCKVFVAVEDPYYKLGIALTDDTLSSEMRISNYFWLHEEQGYILVDGEIYYFRVLRGRPNVVIKLSETPFESP
jgi:hypothetical protein